MKVLILGSTGQLGRYLEERLRREGALVTGVSRSSRPRSLDVADSSAVSALVEEFRPDLVVNLAARSTTREEDVFLHHDTIVRGSLNVLEAVRRHRPGAKVFLAGSGLQFENTGGPIDEKTPFRAASTYALARIQAVEAARYYRSLGLKVYVGYFFHFESPFRGEGHNSVEVVRAVRRIARGEQEILRVGSLDVAKEWNFAGDVAEAVLVLLGQEEAFEAVIGSGEAHTIGEWVEACFSRAGLDWRKFVSQEEGFRPEYERLVSRPDLIRRLGWSPRVGFRELCGMMMEFLE